MSRKIREAYDREVRARPQTEDPSYRFEWDGPVYRMVGPPTDVPNSAVLLTRLDAGTAPVAIQRQLDSFRALGQGFEWKLYDYDEPANLPRLLADAGFVSQEPETLVVRDASAAFAMPPPADGVAITRLDDPDEFGPIADLKLAVWGDEKRARWWVEALQSEKRATPDGLSVYVARAADGAIVAAAWLRMSPDCSFAGLWGGSTKKEWRGRGLYTSLVAHRIAEARERGLSWVMVDCSKDSLPILNRRGFDALATTTPYVWMP
ncbi:MAG: GNAT family N-acetyltransferase [Planctomycetota bacterium]